MKLSEDQYFLDVLPDGTSCLTAWIVGAKVGTQLELSAGRKVEILEMERYSDPADMFVAKVAEVGVAVSQRAVTPNAIAVSSVPAIASLELRFLCPHLNSVYLWASGPSYTF
jgi:hypothetical protein